MSEYIIEIPDEYFASYDEERDMYYPDERDSAMPITPIVRCRDCKFCDNDVFAYWCCHEKYREFEVDSLDGECMGFCAWGVRRES